MNTPLSRAGGRGGRATSAITLAVAALAPIVAGCAGDRSTASRTGPAAAHRFVLSARCTASEAAAPALPSVPVAMERLPGAPDGVTTSPDGRWSFVSLQGPAGRIAINSDTSAPRLVRTVPVPAGGVSGLAVTHTGALLLAASGRGAVVVSVPRAVRGGRAGAVLGELSASARGATAAGGAGEIAISPDDRFAFITLEGAGVLAVFDLRAAQAGHFAAGRGFVGAVKLGVAPLGVAISADGRWVYATSELGRGRGGAGHGTLSVIDLRRAETDPGGAVVSVAPAPCHPVRVAVSPDGRFVWVTARTGNELLGYSASALVTQPQRAALAAVKVGEQPIGLGVLSGGARVIVADSNLAGHRGSRASLSVVDTASALLGGRAVVGYVRAGRLPSEVTVAPGGHTVLVNNTSSGQLEAVDAARLP